MADGLRPDQPRTRVTRRDGNPSLKALLDATPNVIDRQFILLNWFFDAYRQHLPEKAIVRYEDLVSTGGRALASITPAASALEHTLKSRNRAPVYDPNLTRELGERMLATEGAWWAFYTRDSVRALIEGQ